MRGSRRLTRRPSTTRFHPLQGLGVQRARDELLGNAPRAQAGRITLRVYPWADVYVRSKHLGTTPVGTLLVPPGTHVLTLRNAELGVTRKVRVKIRPQQQRVVSIDLTRRARPSHLGKRGVLAAR
jgi:hypothetical protein